MKLWDPKDKATLLSRRGGAGEVVAVAAAGPLLVGGRTREPRSWKLYERMNEISYDVRLSQLQSQASTLEDEEQVERHNSSKGPDLSEGPPLPEPLRRSRLKEQIQKQRAELSAQIEPLRRKPTGAIDLWAQADLELRPLRALTVYAATYAISADGRLAFYSDANLIRRYDTTTEDHLGALIGHRNGITALACSPVALILASGSTDGKVRLWDAREGKLLRELQVGRPITCVQFAPNGRSVAAGCRDGAVVVWS